MKNAGNAIGQLVNKGIDGLKSIINSLSKPSNELKINPGSKVIPKSFTPSIPAVRLPEPCPVPNHKDWNELSDKLKSSAKTLGLVAVVNYLLSKVDISKNYKHETNKHHIVLRTGQYGTGLFSMENARENVIAACDKRGINDERNLVDINTAVHVHLHTDAYKIAIVTSFSGKLREQAGGNAKTIRLLAAYKSFLISINKFFFG